MTRALSISLVVLCVAAPAAAQDATAPPQDARTRAAAHFDRGIQFFNEQRYDAALAEFARAHELAPAHQTLYNLARVHAALGHAVEAARAYAQYLEQAGGSLPAARRAEAEEALAEQRQRIGTLRVTSSTDGATVAIDGVDVAATPLPAPIELSAGAHIVELRAPGRETVRRAVSIAGGAESRLEVELREEVVPRGALRVSSSVPQTEIAVDGQVVGLTPLSSTLPLREGRHVVRARRLGYREETRQIAIEAGAEVELSFEMRREPAAPPAHLGRLRLQLPDAPYLVRVDGEPMLGLDLELPIGAHAVEIEVTDRRPYEGTVRIAARTIERVAPPLTWTLDARRERLEAADTQRTTGITLTAVGAAITASGLAVLIWNEAEITRTDDRLRFINQQLSTCRTMGFDPGCEALEAEGEQLADAQQTQNLLRGVSIAGTVVGAALAATGLGLWLAAPSEDAVDRSARARLTLGPGGLRLHGAF